MPKLEELMPGDAFIYDQKMIGFRANPGGAVVKFGGAITVFILSHNILKPNDSLARGGDITWMDPWTHVERIDLDAFEGEHCIYRTWRAKEIVDN